MRSLHMPAFLRMSPTRVLGSLALASALIVGVGVVASEDQVTQKPTDECVAMSEGGSTALRNRLHMNKGFFTSAESSMKRAMNQSCIMSIALLDINLSGLMPDFNLVETAMKFVVDKITKFITNKVCEPLVNMVGNWNNLVAAISLEYNANAAIDRWANSVISEFDIGSGGIGYGNNTDSGELSPDAIVIPPDASFGLGSNYPSLRADCVAAAGRYMDALSVSTTNTTTLDGLRGKALDSCERASSYYRLYSTNTLSHSAAEVERRVAQVREYESLRKACTAARAAVPTGNAANAPENQQLVIDANESCKTANTYFDANVYDIYGGNNNILILD